MLSVEEGLRMIVFVLLALLVGFLAGVAIAYQLLERRLGQQRREHVEQTRQAIEELEKKHETRMRQAIVPIQQDYEAQLTQSQNAIAELQSTQEAQIQQAIQATRSQYEAELARTQQTLEQVRADYERQIQELRRATDRPTDFPEDSYEGRMSEIQQHLREKQETLPDPDAPPIPRVERNQAALEAILPQSPVAESADLLNPEWGSISTPPEASYEGRVEELVQNLRQQYETLPDPEETEISRIDRNQAALVAVLPQAPVVESAALMNPTIAPPQVPISETPILLVPEQTANLHPYELCQQVLGWGETGQVGKLSQLINYARHASPDVRQSVAIALGNLIKRNRLRSNGDMLIPILGKLSQDAKPKVRQAAIMALGSIHSPQALPFLQRALRDPIGYVSQSASIAIRQLKLAPLKPPVQNPRPKR
ncbi:HEAT repeat domain-containing protein [Desertifilum sp. FACHB-1129]|uniref:HEAT repeat domain-containing protein n=1 Tax=unclassified Desertifilum TaxID=2621682 RepID=UPI001682F0D7|nr:MULTISPECIES: HEAT repeat domain-containing protein [unclassified Desertifilum]MBD2310434.1 HEAT repeat domain-containing protein [Desertifilum sp. FACHB-1129]MBD2321886.1 HEAT repeat domain-containing protein [Desertifilum sp. FACHB-866]MBD2332013.1 HEAT repeat domain-containing protein [Desertifilum sp. FACHB-868]MDA0208951.1 HEAT repeat domain-containing protein [Cyanobacteria bacterium FC1]